MEPVPKRRRYTGARGLTGQPDDYRDPVGAVLYQMNVLLTEYAARGGDLSDVRISTSLERTSERVSRPRLMVRLEGVG